MLNFLIQAILGIGLALLLAALGITQRQARWLAKKPFVKRIFGKNEES